METWLTIVAVLVLSAFFSGMEIAYVASSRLRVELDRKEHSLYSKVSGIFFSNPGQYLSTILIGNNIALVVYSMLMAQVICSNIVVETLVSSVIVILFAEFLPKSVVRREPHLYLRIFSVPIFSFYILFYPIAKFTTALSKVFSWIITGNFVAGQSENPHFNLSDLQTLVDDGVQQGEGEDCVQPSDLLMFQNALDLSDLKARDCMVPRVEIEAIDVDDSMSELRKLFISSNFSRIPVYRESVDNIIGYVSSKSLFGQTGEHISDFILDILYVPESFSAQKLLEDFIRKRKNIAVVIDEFGVTAGIVTIEDIIEQIVGDIEDEHDQDDMVERPLPTGENGWVFSGRQEIDYLNQKYNLGIAKSEEYDTLAGWILFKSEELPESGSEYIIDGLKVRIKRASDNLISLVEIRKTH